MTLRGRLIFSLAPVMILSLAVLSFIIYLTYDHSMKENNEALFKSKISEFYLKTESAFVSDIDAIDRRVIVVLEQLIAGDAGKQVTAPHQTYLLQDIIENSAIFSSIALIDHVGKIIVSHGATTPDYQELFIRIRALGVERHPRERQPHQRAMLIPEGLFVVYHADVHSPLSEYGLVLGIDLQKFKHRLIMPGLLDLQAFLLVSLEKELLLVINNTSGDQAPTAISGEDILSNLGRYDSFPSQEDNIYIFPAQRDICGLNFHFIIPRSLYWKDIIVLKDRVVTALIILLWISVWTVLIIAFKLTNPIINLSKATQRIINFDYDEELTFKANTSETQDLIQNFEKMRCKVRELVVEDPLTKTYNRRYLMHALELEIARAHRTGHSLACIMLDIDHFKKINDTYGHQCGDMILQELGRILMKNTRNYDTVARYGGEEFCILLPNANIEEGYSVAEKIRKWVEQKPFQDRDTQISWTLSLGVSECDTSEVNTGAQLIKSADRALYKAKAAGRNRTMTTR